MKGSKPQPKLQRGVKPKPRSAKSDASILLWTHLCELRQPDGLLETFPEYRFFVGRKWRFDFVAVRHAVKLGIEIEGGAWIRGGGGHNRGQGFIDDMEKYNHATLAGWRLLRFTPQQVCDGSAIAFIRKVLEAQ